MEAVAKARYVRCSATKARRVIDLVRGSNAGEAVTTLKFAPQAASLPIRKALESAIANIRVKAQQTGSALNERDLFITEAYVDEGPTLKRFQPRAKGVAGRILKRTSHITIVVAQKESVR